MELQPIVVSIFPWDGSEGEWPYVMRYSRTYVLQAMGKACAQITASKGYLAKADRDYIADQIVTGASAGETSVNRLVALALGDPASKYYASLRPPVRHRAPTGTCK
jgi:hypothetical protein